MSDDMYGIPSLCARVSVKLFTRLRNEIEETGEWKVRKKRRMKYCDKSSVSYDCPILFMVFCAGKISFSASVFLRRRRRANLEEFVFVNYKSLSLWDDIWFLDSTVQIQTVEFIMYRFYKSGSYISHTMRKVCFNLKSK